MKGKYILITGGTGDLGRSVTIRIAGSGANIYLPYRKEADLDRLRKEMGEKLFDQVKPVKADLLMEDEVASLVQSMPAVHILIHLMGGFAMGRTADTTRSGWQAQMDLNLTSAFLIIKHCLGPMQKGHFGRIVTIGSRAAVETPGGMAAYVASKAGLVALTRSVAAEFREHNITANVLLPSVIDTQANREAMGGKNADRWVKTQSLADVIDFLISEAANDIRGAVIPVYGGV
jgi:NAD(P)-dependent dehydrogenase (short-subunit alcohol dehydrogenase family)